MQRGVIQTPRDRKDRKEKARLTSTQVWGGQAACRGPERAGPPHGWQGAAEPGFRARRRRRLQIPRRPQDRAANAAGPADAIAREAPRRCRPRLVRRPVRAKPPRQRDSHRARVPCTHRVCAPPSSRHGARAPRGLEQTRVTSLPHEAPPREAEASSPGGEQTCGCGGAWSPQTLIPGAEWEGIESDLTADSWECTWGLR